MTENKFYYDFSLTAVQGPQMEELFDLSHLTITKRNNLPKRKSCSKLHQQNKIYKLTKSKYKTKITKYED